MRKPKKNPWAQDAARKRALKLGPERCREIATLASQAAAKVRSEKAAARRAAKVEPPTDARDCNLCVEMEKAEA